MKRNNLKGSIILCTAALIWGLAFVAQNEASSVPSFAVNCMRSVISAVFLFVILLIKNAKSKTKIIPANKKQRKTVLLGGLLCGVLLTISVNFQQFGIAFYPKGAAVEAHSGFITALYVIIVPIVSVFFRKKVSPSVWVAVAVSLIGFYLLCFSGGIGGFYKGDIFVFVCAVAFSGHILVVDKFVEDIGGIRLCMLQFAVCGVLSGILSALFEYSKLNLNDIITAAPYIIYLGIMSSGIAYTLQIVGQRYAEPSIASISMSLESVFAALGGWFAGNVLHFGEERILTAPEIVGCVLVFAAVILAQLPPPRKRQKTVNT